MLCGSGSISVVRKLTISELVIEDTHKNTPVWTPFKGATRIGSPPTGAIPGPAGIDHPRSNRTASVTALGSLSGFSGPPSPPSGSPPSPGARNRSVCSPCCFVYSSK